MYGIYSNSVLREYMELLEQAVHLGAKRHLFNLFFCHHVEDKKECSVNQQRHDKSYEEADDDDVTEEHHGFVDNHTENAHNQRAQGRKKESSLYFLLIA